MTNLDKNLNPSEPLDEAENIEEVQQVIIEDPPKEVHQEPIDMNESIEVGMERGKISLRSRKKKTAGKGGKRKPLSFSLKDLNIVPKLILGFGVMVALVLVVVGVSYQASTTAGVSLNRTKDLRLPTSNASSNAKTAMFEMLANIRGYLSLGDSQFQENYEDARDEFLASLVELEALSVNWTNPENVTRLDDLKEKFDTWVLLPPQMFALTDDPQANQPGLRILTEEGAPRFASGLTNITNLIEAQANREPSIENQALFKNMADFRGSWNSMASGIRGYLATLNQSFLDEYNAALAINQGAYEFLANSTSVMTPSQLTTFNQLAETRDELLPFPEQMFEAAAGERAREDFFILSSQAAPQAAEIVTVLQSMSDDQAVLLSTEVDEGSALLTSAQTNTLIVGVISFLVAIGLTLIFRQVIGIPVIKLAEVAETLGSGDFSVRAVKGSRDEIGVLADTFNQMASTVEAHTKQLEERGMEMEASQRVTFAASERTSPEDFLNLLVNLIADQFDIYHAQVYMIDEARENAVLEQSTGYAGRQLLTRGHQIPLDETGLVTAAIRTGESVLVGDVTLDPNFLANPLLPLTKSEMAIPLKVEDVVIGVLDVQDRVANRFGEQTIPVFESMAEHVAFLYQNNELLGQITEQSENLEKFSEQLRSAAEIASQLGSILDPEQLLNQSMILMQSRFNLYHVHIYLYDEETQTLKVETGSGVVGMTMKEQGHKISLDAEQSVVAQCARDQAVILLADTAENPTFMPNPLLPNTRSEMAVPLVSGGTLFGVLDMQDEVANRFSDMDADTFATLGGQIATTLQTAQLFAEQRATQKELENREAQFRTLVDYAPEAILVFNAKTYKFLDANENAMKLFGYDREELLKLTPAGISPDSQPNGKASADVFGHHIAQALDGAVPVFDFYSINKYEDQFPCEVRLVLLPSTDDKRMIRASITDITERIEAQDTIIQGDRLKSEFLANMSHELRTPLNSIIGYTDVLLMGIEGELDAEVYKDIESIQENGQTLLRIINDILDLAKIEAGRMTLEFSEFEVPTLLDELVTNNSGLLLNKSVELIATSEPNLPPLIADRGRLSQILTNLISNAVKFTNEGTIQLIASKLDESILLEVKDTGIGISNEDLEKIFEEFQQADSSSTRTAEGTGLGLTITRRFVQMHGGTISVQSIEGQGSTFTICLPIAANISNNVNGFGQKAAPAGLELSTNSTEVKETLQE